MSPSMQQDQMPESDPSETTRSTQAVAKLGRIFNAGVLAETIIKSTIAGTVTNYNYNYGNEQETKTATLNWLSSLDYERKQQQFVERRAPNTGQWLLNLKEFAAWRSKETHKLWCFGMPGAGKTFLASIVISHLESSESGVRNQKPLVAYLYLTYQEQPPLEHLLGSIAKQFLDPSKEHPQLLKKLSSQSRQQHPSLKEVHEILADVTRDRQVYIIVDALDEYPPDLRDDLVHHLRKIKKDINLFVTSRRFEGFERTARGFERLDIVAQNQDIQEYIDYVIERHSELRNSIDRAPDLRTDIGETLIKKSSGMFLLAKLHMDAIAAQLSPYDVRKALEELPESREDTYKSTMTRIRSQTENKRKYAILILSWIVWASRPLSVGEMLHALAVEEGDSCFQNGRTLLKEGIPEFCCGLVVIDEANTVRLVHYTAQDYFTEHKAAEFPNFHGHIASTCASYLCMLPLDQPYVPLEDKLEKYPFARYAGEYLDYHVRKVRNEATITKVAQTMQRFLQTRHQSDFYHSLLLYLGAYYCTTRNLLEKGVKLSWLTRLLLKIGEFSGPDHQDQELPVSELRTTELHLAVFLGCTNLVYEYIKNGIDVDALDEFRNSALVIAFEKNDDEIIAILLDRGVYVDLETESGHSFLLCAARKDLGDTVQRILREAHGGEYRSAADPPETHNKSRLQHSITDQAGSSPLDGQSHQGSNPRTNPSVPTSPPSRKLRRYTRLLFAAYNGDTATITKLVQQGKVNPEIRNSWMPSKPKWVRFVTTGLFLAVERRHVGAAEKLLDFNIDPDSRDSEHRTLLHRAVERNDLSMAKLLLNRNASTQLRDANGMTAWTANATPDRAEVLTLLREHGANPNDQDGQGVNILYGAAAGGDVQQVDFLLSQGVDPSLRTKFGWAPLHWAANNGHLECVRLLLKWKAELSPVSDQGTTPLDQARNNKQDTIAGILEDAGAETAQSIYAKRKG